MTFAHLRRCASRLLGFGAVGVALTSVGLACGRTDVDRELLFVDVEGGAPRDATATRDGADGDAVARANDADASHAFEDATDDAPDAGRATDAPAAEASDATDDDRAPDGTDACVSTCAPGQTECEDGGVATCTTMAPGCERWGAPVSCGASEQCIATDAGAACVSTALRAPRPVAPLSTATVTSHRPTFRWDPPPGESGASVEICRDRACTQTVTTFSATGASGAPAQPLAPGLYYWRLRGIYEDTTSDPSSIVWELFVGTVDAPVDTSWSTILDVNEDGLADVVTEARVYLGSTDAAGPPTVTMLAPPPGSDVFGSALSSAGDVNGDGYSDVIVGDWGTGGGVGTAYLYLGGPSGIVDSPYLIPAPTTVNGGFIEFAFSVASAGDVNGDGYADVLVGAPLYGAEGAAYLYFGSAQGLSPTPTLIPYPGPTGSIGGFGMAVSSAGDVDGDGYGDVAIAEPDDIEAGRVFVYTGSANGLSTTATEIDGPPSFFAFFGNSVGCADVDGDGHADLVVGAPYFNHVADSLDNQGGGQAYVYLGGAGGISTAPATTFDDPAGSLADFGAWVTGAGDVNGDGYPDLVVGSQTAGTFEYLGGPNGFASAPDETISWGGAVVGVGDTNGDGFDDVLVTNLLFLGSASGLALTGTVP